MKQGTGTAIFKWPRSWPMASDYVILPAMAANLAGGSFVSSGEGNITLSRYKWVKYPNRHWDNLQRVDGGDPFVHNAMSTPT